MTLKSGSQKDKRTESCSTKERSDGNQKGRQSWQFHSARRNELAEGTPNLKGDLPIGSCIEGQPYLGRIRCMVVLSIVLTAGRSTDNSNGHKVTLLITLITGN